MKKHKKIIIISVIVLAAAAAAYYFFVYNATVYPYTDANGVTYYEDGSYSYGSITYNADGSTNYENPNLGEITDPVVSSGQSKGPVFNYSGSYDVHGPVNAQLSSAQSK